MQFITGNLIDDTNPYPAFILSIRNYSDQFLKGFGSGPPAGALWSVQIAALDFSDVAYASSFSYRISSVAGVPEPASWAMMISGFAMAGGQLRRAWRKTAVAFA